MSWGLNFIAKDTYTAIEHLKKRTEPGIAYIPEKLSECIQNDLACLNNREGYHVQVESNGHMDTGNGFGGNGAYKITFVKVVQ
jgi:hypothetical protein